MAEDQPGTDGGARVVVVIASAGRPELLGRVVAKLRHQSLPVIRQVVSTPGPEDLPAAGLPSDVVVVHARGLTSQRNAGVAAVAASHIFFDDDAVVREDYLEHAMALFAHHPEVVGVTGRVLLDGSAASAPAVLDEAAAAALERSRTEVPTGAWTPVTELYGCNFGYRTGAVPGLRFDERLPLYSWLEDLDFAGRLRPAGALAKADDCVVVHLGVKSGGRTAHQRLGYSQGMNPAYLLRKNTSNPRRATYEVLPRLARNAAASLAGPERAWRRRRLLGNAKALGDLARARLTPERILRIPPS